MSSILPVTTVADALALSDRFYPEQKATAAKLLAAFQAGNRQALLLALMQSGKTGVFLFLAFTMLHLGMVRNVFFLCGSDEKELHQQLVDDVRGKLWRFVYEELGLVGVAARDLCEDMAAQIQVAKSNDIKDMVMKERTLLVWDESHYAQSITNRPAQFFARSGVGVTGREVTDAMWEAHRSFYLSVSATPFSEFSDATHPLKKATNTKALVLHEPGAAYKGVHYFADHGRIRESFSIERNSERFVALLRSRAGEAKYCIVRTLNQEALRRCCEEAGVAYKTHYSGASLPGGMDALETAPDAFTVIGLKGMCRMGKVVRKRHIAIVFEESQSARSDTVLQSLLGRMCGYDAHPDEPLEIFISRKMLAEDPTTSWSELDRYGLFAMGKGVAPLKFLNSKKAISEASAHPLLVPRRLPLRSTNRACVQAILDDVIATPYSDPIQQEEVVEALTEALADATVFSSSLGFRDFQAVSYAHIRAKLPAAYSAGSVFKDDFESHDKQFLVYKDAAAAAAAAGAAVGAGHLYFVGFTYDATEETILASKNPLANTTGAEVFAEGHAAIAVRPTSHVERVDRLADLSRGREVGRHTLWIHTSLRDTAEFRAFHATRSGGGRGRAWDRRWPGSQANYFRVVILIVVMAFVV